MILLRVSQKAILLGIASTLAACSGGKIAAVQNAVLPADPSYKIGQAFDHRKICTSTKWDTVKDGRGRTIIEYRCELSGVAAFYKSRDDKRLSDLQGTIQSLEGNYVAGMNSLQAKMAGEQKTLADLNAGIVDPDTQARVDADKKKLQDQTEELAALKSGDVPSIISTTNRVSASLPTDAFNDGNLVTIVGDARDHLSLSTKANPSSQPSAAISRDESGITSASPNAVYELQSNIRLLRSDIAQSSATLEQDKSDPSGIRTLIDNVSGYIKSDQDQLAKETAGKAEYFGNVEKNVGAQIKAIDPNPVTRGDELFQWTLADDNTPDLVYAGAELVHQDGHTDDIAYSSNSVERVVGLVIHNSSISYSDYEPQIAP
ncbi:hypothetical protein B0E50_00450 [Rhodanobacter sp. C01]|nr:hypothetical protein B0E50_00450 [Rhodanobacter sp. C01]